jgi:hypothetical protein
MTQRGPFPTEEKVDFVRLQRFRYGGNRKTAFGCIVFAVTCCIAALSLSHRPKERMSETVNLAPPPPAVVEPVHCSLWLVAEDGQRKPIDNVVQSLAHARHAPVFRPHFTILSHWHQCEAEFIDRVKQFAASLKGPLKLTVEAVGRGHSKFQCVFLKPVSDENVQTYFDFQKSAIRFWNGVPDLRPSPFPHMSLLYDVPKDDEDWAKCVKMAEDAFAAEDFPIPQTLVFDKLQVVQIDPKNVAGWYSIYDAQL